MQETILKKRAAIPLTPCICHSKLFEQFSESKTAFGIGTGGYLKAETSFLKRVTGRIFRLGSNFREAFKNFTF
jgi:hypothetical protein